MDVSVVIPVYRDQQALARMLETLAALDPRPREVVVVDGGSDAEIEALCIERGLRLPGFPALPGRTDGSGC